MSQEPDYDPLRGQQRVFTTQLVLCTWIGVSCFGFFCLLRYKWPHIYAIRTLRRSNHLMKNIPRNYFGWIRLVLKDISDDDVLLYSGLDNYVFIMFFKLGMKIFWQFLLLAILILSPIRYVYTGHYDKDEIPWIGFIQFIVKDEYSKVEIDDDFPQYLWVYPVFAYIFSILVYIHLFDYTKRIIKTRQKYLASQDSITDRTIKVDGIPRRLLLQNNHQEILKDFIEDLGIGKVYDIKLIYDYAPLDSLFTQRKSLLRGIERYISSNYKYSKTIYDDEYPKVVLKQPSQVLNDVYVKSQLGKLNVLDENIKQLQLKYHNDHDIKPLTSAFITMDSVASAQMAAQTILDPRVYKLMVNLAPAPTDIKWQNLKSNYYQKLFKSYFVTIIIILSYFPILFLVSSLATLLDLKSISKFWPELGDLIKKSNWLTTFVTGILPPLLYSLLNITLPYFYRYLSRYQGYSSNSDVELSSLSKNFFYVFFNLFLVFIITGTIWDYLLFIRDTTKIAFQLASSLKKKSLFYVDLILLQGLGMFPIRLLQVGDVVLLNLIGRIFLIKKIILKTPRDYRFYYFTPPVFDFGIQLPQHILIFLIILIYSVVSTKIVVSGLVYFVLGYLVYKYQLIYNYVHPPHSTGKVWPMIFRRLILGIILFQLFMCGTLALEGAVLLSILCSPLILISLIITYNYEKYYLPLNNFIALRAIQSPLEFDKEFDDDLTQFDLPDFTFTLGESSSNTETDSMIVNGDYTIDYMSVLSPKARLAKRRISTVDEEREQFSSYIYPNLVDELDGPMVEFSGENVSLLRLSHEDESGESEVQIVHKSLIVSEWE